ncbi:MAG: hypothetical protein ACK5V3_08005 [Bdellovibrionales bacterium]
MGAKQTKLLTVASNGQISIGKAWAGRQIVIEEVAEGELHIRAGVFVPDSQKTFHTKTAKESLTEFNDWEENKPPKAPKSNDILTQLRKQKKSRAR